MFRSLCKTLNRSRIINGGDPKFLSLCSQNPSFLLQFHINKVRFLSSSSIDQNSGSSSSFVVSYLMNSCGLTEKQALSASKKLNLKTTSDPESVVTLFEDYGFPKPDISKIITKKPLLLMFNPHKTIKPKLDYFISKDISRLEVIRVLSSNPEILYRSLENHIIPFFDSIKNIVGTDRYVFIVFGRTTHVSCLNEKLMLNIQVLRDQGVPQSNIVKSLIYQPRTLMIAAQKFKDILQEVKGMGFDPCKTAFLRSIQVIASMSKSTWEKKLNAYRKWGWSEDKIQSAFMLQPICMTHSVKKISTTMDYLVNRMGISSLVIARCPTILSYSLEKRIIPRCSVYRILVSKGLINEDQICVYTLLSISEESFVKKFVIKYEKQAPELLKIKELS